MKKWTKSVLVTVLSAVFLLGCMGTAWAINNDSKFTTSETDASIDQFFLIKDYDSIYDTVDAPKSSSPAETFTYTITPYHVWNAGQTYDSNGDAIQIDKDNMPMLKKPSNYDTQKLSYSEVAATGTESKKLIVTQTVEKGKAEYVASGATETATNDEKAPIDLPTYDTVGDYWYKVVETIGTSNRTTGVVYGTNSATNGSVTNEHQNFNHTATYYIHVQVSQGTSSLIRNVTLHTNAPDTSKDNAGYNASDYRTTLYGANKVQAIENRYYAGQLKVEKVVNGSAGVQDQYFKVRVKFLKPAGTVVNSNIAIEDAYYDTGNGSTHNYTKDNNKIIPGQYNETTAPDAGTLFKWDKAENDTTAATAVVEFYVKHGTTVSFYNIPFGINYTVEEYSTGDWGYLNAFTMTRGTGELTTAFNGNTELLEDKAIDSGSHFYDDDATTTTIPPENIGAQGSISGPNADKVTITNTKELTIDIGVITENAPYIAMLAVAGAALFLLFLRKKNPSEV